MDDLDHNLLMAWNRVFERCKADPREARRRYDRVANGRVLDRPHRTWCVAVRASDTRLGRVSVGSCELKGGVDCEPMDTLPLPPHSPSPCAHRAHEIVLDAWLLRELGGPVWLDYPGVPIDVAAHRLGRHKEALRRWMPARPGRTRAERAAAGRLGGLDERLVWTEHPPTGDCPLGVRYEPARSLGRNSGMETPVVWSDGPLDPGAVKGRAPFRGWGTMWMSLAQRIPAGFEQVLVREPRVIPYPDSAGEFRGRFRGWWWRCPGVLGAAGSTPAVASHRRGLEGDESGCGRLVQTLYAPLPVWTVGRALGIEEGLVVEGLAGEWLPGVMDRWAGRRSLACASCWRVRRSTTSSDTGWNDLVSYLSGGLLYGKEVARPSWFACERKRADAERRVAGGREACTRAPGDAADQSIAVKLSTSMK